MTKFDAMEQNFVALTDEELMNVDGGLLITLTWGGVALVTVTGKALAVSGLVGAGAVAGYFMP